MLNDVMQHGTAVADPKTETLARHREAKATLQSIEREIVAFRDRHLIYAPHLPLNQLFRTPFSWKSPLDRPALEPVLQELQRARAAAGADFQATLKELARY